MSRTEDFFGTKPVSFDAPITRSPPVPTASAEASTSKAHKSKPSLEERLLKAVQDLARNGADEGCSSSDEWESISSQEEDSGDEQEEVWTPQDSPLATMPTYLPNHHSFDFPPLKPALKSSTSMSRTSSGSSVSFDEEETLWETYSPRSYSRRGPAPIKRLTIEQLIEMQNLGCLPWHCVLLPARSLDGSPTESPPGISKFDSSSSEEDST